MGTDGEDVRGCEATGDEDQLTIDVVRIDPVSLDPVATFTGMSGDQDFFVTADSIWTAARDDDLVLRISLE